MASIFGDSDTPIQEPEITQQQAPDEGQPAQEPQEPTEGQEPIEGQEGQQEQLIAGKFRTQEELVDAYERLKERIGQQGNELGYWRALATQLQQRQGQPQETPQSQEAPEPVDAEKWLEELYEKGPEAVKQVVEQAIREREEARLAEQTEAQRRVMELQQRKLAEAQAVALRHPDMPEYKDRMAQIIRENPILAQRDDGMETAYWIAKNERAQGGAQPNPQKQSAAMPQGGGQRTTQRPMTDEEKIRQAVFGNPETKGVFG